MLLGTYVLFQYTPKEWREEVVEIDMKLKKITKMRMGNR